MQALSLVGQLKKKAIRSRSMQPGQVRFFGGTTSSGSMDTVLTIVTGA